MLRLYLFLALTPLLAQEKNPRPPKQQPPVVEQEPPEENESLKPEEYTFNPLKSKKEVQTGNFYFKKHSYRAAANRFLSATRWNPQNSEAWLRLGEAREKQGDVKAAREAWSKYLELKPKSKEAPEVRKKLQQ